MTRNEILRCVSCGHTVINTTDISLFSVVHQHDGSCTKCGITGTIEVSQHYNWLYLLHK